MLSGAAVLAVTVRRSDVTMIDGAGATVRVTEARVAESVAEEAGVA